MTLILACFLGGALLLALEVVLPGAVLGIAGGLCLLVGVGFAFSDYCITGGAFAALAMLVFLAITLYAELVWLPRSRIARALTVSETQTKASQPPLADPTAVVGKVATALTPLVPSGVILLEGGRYEAFSRSGMVEGGATVRVIGVDNFRLIVSKT